MMSARKQLKVSGLIISVFTMMLGISLSINKVDKYFKANAAIDVSGFTLITTENIGLISPGSKVYFINEDNYKNGLGGTSTSSGFKVTNLEDLTYFEITDIDNNDIAFKYLSSNSTFKNKYIDITKTGGAALSLSSTTKTYLTLHDNGRLSTGEHYLTYNNSTRACLSNVSTFSFYNMYLDSSIGISVDEFANDMLNDLSCDNTGINAPSLKEWSNMKSIYNKLSNSDKEDLLNIDGDQSGSDIEKAIAKYDFVIQKYNSTLVEVYEDFIGRVGDKITLSNKGNITDIINDDSNINITLITLISAISITTLLTYIFIKRKNKSL